MIQEIVERWELNKDKIRASFEEAHPNSYEDIVKIVAKNVCEYGGRLYLDGVQTITYGDYQGDHLFIIPSSKYYPNVVWIVAVTYGSCSGCDTLESIRDVGRYNDPPNKQQVDDYMTLALHIVQRMIVYEI